VANHDGEPNTLLGLVWVFMDWSGMRGIGGEISSF